MSAGCGAFGTGSSCAAVRVHGANAAIFLCEFPIEIRSRGADKWVFWWLLGSEALQLRPNAVWEAFQRPRRRSTGKPLSELTATPERLRTGESM